MVIKPLWTLRENAISGYYQLYIFAAFCVVSPNNPLPTCLTKSQALS